MSSLLDMCMLCLAPLPSPSRSTRHTPDPTSPSTPPLTPAHAPQVIVSSLLDMCMLGVVFARFSAPFKRAQSIRFSAAATVARHPSGYWALTLRWGAGGCKPSGLGGADAQVRWGG